MIKRKLLSSVEEHLSEKEITLIVGPRQAGKTTLMLLLKQNLEAKGIKTVMLNLDIENDKQFFSSQAQLVRKIKLQLGDSYGVVFIDEIQRKEDAGIFLKGIYDMNLPYKFVISGSGSLELKEKIHESLAGRKKIFELSTLSFEEFVNFKTDYAYEKNLDEFFSLEKEKSFELLKEYMFFGGYPKLVLEKTLEGKQSIINEIYQSYIEKDISYLLRVKKTEGFTHLVKIMASQIGRMVNIAELSRTFGLAQKTIKDYLWYLQKTFILHKVTPYFTNTRKEITKSPVFYFYDLGIRNYAKGVFNGISDVYDIGYLFQNFVYSHLRETIIYTTAHIHFWHTKYGGEVDFIIDRGEEVIPFEIKYQHMKKPEIPRSFRNFIAQYKSSKGFIINLNLDTTIKEGNTIIHFVPFYKIASILRET